MKRLFLALLLLCFGTLAADAANRFGVCATTCTWDGSSTAMWSTTSGGATGASVPSTSDSVVFDGATCVGGTTCTITVNTAFSIISLTMGACTGTTTGCILDFSVNNNNVSLTTTFSASGSGTRTLKLGSSVISITGVNGNWDATTVTNFTLTPATSNITFTGNSSNPRTFAGGGKTYATLTVAANTGPGPFQITDTGNTFATMTVSAPNWLQFAVFTTTTITNAITWAGTSTKQLLVSSSSPALSINVNSAANAAITWTSFYRMTFGGGGTHAATNSFNNGNNSGITITAPSSIGGSGTTCILGGWLLWRDFDSHELNDNFPAFLDKAA